MDRKENVVFIVLISVAIIFSGISLLSLKGLGDRLEGLRGEMHSLRSMVQGKISEVADITQALQEQACRWEPEQIEAVEMRLGRASVKLGWYLKEYRAGSRVYFNYRRQGEAKYTSKEATEGSGGYFSILLDLEFSPEPLWEYHYTTFTRNAISNAPAEKRAAGVGPDVDPQSQYEYYISVVDEENIRTGEPKVLSLEKLSCNYYSTLHSFLELQKKGVSVELIEEKCGEPRFTMTGARLELCRGDEVVKWLPLVKSAAPGSTVKWEVKINAIVEEECDSVCLVVTFIDGESFSRRQLLNH